MGPYFSIRHRLSFFGELDRRLEQTATIDIDQYKHQKKPQTFVHSSNDFKETENEVLIKEKELIHVQNVHTCDANWVPRVLVRKHFDHVSISR